MTVFIFPAPPKNSVMPAHIIGIFDWTLATRHVIFLFRRAVPQQGIASRSRPAPPVGSLASANERPVEARSGPLEKILGMKQPGRGATEDAREAPGAVMEEAE